MVNVISNRGLNDFLHLFECEVKVRSALNLLHTLLQYKGKGLAVWINKVLVEDNSLIVLNSAIVVNHHLANQTAPVLERGFIEFVFWLLEVGESV